MNNNLRDTYVNDMGLRGGGVAAAHSALAICVAICCVYRCHEIKTKKKKQGSLNKIKQ